MQQVQPSRTSHTPSNSIKMLKPTRPDSYMLAFGFALAAVAVFWVTFLMMFVLYVCSIILVRTIGDPSPDDPHHDFLHRKFGRLVTALGGDKEQRPPSLTGLSEPVRDRLSAGAGEHGRLGLDVLRRLGLLPGCHVADTPMPEGVVFFCVGAPRVRGQLTSVSL